MTIFIGNLTLLFGAAFVCLGLIILHFAKKENSKLLYTSSFVLMAVATLSILCSGFSYMKSSINGEFDRPHVKSSRFFDGNCPRDEGRRWKRSLRRGDRSEMEDRRDDSQREERNQSPQNSKQDPGGK